MVLFCSSSLMTFSLPHNPFSPHKCSTRETFNAIWGKKKQKKHTQCNWCNCRRAIKISSSCKHNARINIIMITTDCTLNVYKVAYRHKTTLTKKNHLPLRVSVNCPCCSISLIYDSHHHETGWYFLFYRKDMAPVWYTISLTMCTLLPLKYPYLREIQIPNYFISSSNTSF